MVSPGTPVSVERLDERVCLTHRSVPPRTVLVYVVGGGAAPAVSNSWRTGVGCIDDRAIGQQTVGFRDTRVRHRAGFPRHASSHNASNESMSCRVVGSRRTPTTSSGLEGRARSWVTLSAQRCSCGTVVAGAWSAAQMSARCADRASCKSSAHRGLPDA